MKSIITFIVICITLSSCSHTAAIHDEHNRKPSAEPVSLQQTKQILSSSPCAVELFASEVSNPDRPTVILLAEHHYQPDIRQAVTCARDALVKNLTQIGFIGLEGVKYGVEPEERSIRFLQLESLPRKVDLIGIEKQYYAIQTTTEINRIDDEHQRVAKLKMQVGLTTAQKREYDYITWRSYQLIIVQRSQEWAQHIRKYLDKSDHLMGIVQGGENHITAFQDALRAEKLNYITYVGKVTNPICSCEAYFVKRKDARDKRNCRQVCNDDTIPAVWD